MLQPVEKLAGLPFITLSKKSFNDENINNKLAALHTLESTCQ